MKKQKNKCDECGAILEKTYLLTKYGIPVTVWVCPKGEIYQVYQVLFKKEYQK